MDQIERETKNDKKKVKRKVKFRRFVQKYRYPLCLLIVLQYLKAVCLVFFAIDPPLSVVIAKGVTPYGVLWYLVNLPMVYGFPEIWQVELWIIDTAVSIFMFSRMGHNQYILFQATSLWYFEQGLQNLSVLWFSVLGLIHPGFIFLSIITKLPFGWLDNNHLNYAINGHMNDVNHLKTYSVIVIWWIYPTIHWLRRKKNEF